MLRATRSAQNAVLQYLSPHTRRNTSASAADTMATTICHEATAPWSGMWTSRLHRRYTHTHLLDMPNKRSLWKWRLPRVSSSWSKLCRAPSCAGHMAGTDPNLARRSPRKRAHHTEATRRGAVWRKGARALEWEATLAQRPAHHKRPCPPSQSCSGADFTRGPYSDRGMPRVPRTNATRRSPPPTTGGGSPARRRPETSPRPARGAKRPVQTQPPTRARGCGRSAWLPQGSSKRSSCPTS